ncbi:hypothetical protein EIN_096790 [Entamoeba invadens IP1]|uniref:Uncharacterized protein n=1 Tax=Entamoeba invadens IP1 TaxID=370355 RepID=A0A0A1U0L9_ENTIV|nr:hypothetical protein EIN_096790 [Entamoeba invadens IP1]ELP87412.1 hypothetical protein EIN_096790 [Entamoeba invadens IP1]|eukprot:XP_004254183.1 hypothetical protein EIN_096790 [Entamoeba invadens IP1]
MSQDHVIKTGTVSIYINASGINVVPNTDTAPDVASITIDQPLRGEQAEQEPSLSSITNLSPSNPPTQTIAENIDLSDLLKQLEEIKLRTDDIVKEKTELCKQLGISI